MKKITKSLIFLAASAMAFASCAKEEAPVSTPIEGSIRVRFVADAALTKVGLNPNDGDTEFTASWDDDDQIAITSFVSGGAMKETKDAIWSSSYKYFSTEFKASDYAQGSYDFVGVWPVGKDADKLFPAERHQNGAKYNGEYDIMKSSRTNSATLSENATIVLNMVRQTSIAYFHITSALNEKIVSATLTTDQPIASSNATLDYTGFEPNVESDGVKSIKLIIDGDEMSSSDFKLWFNVLPVNYGTMTLRVETQNHSFSLEKMTAGEWKAGELNKVVIKEVPAEKWAEIERPTGETTETLTMTEKKASDGVITFENGNIKAEFNKNSGSSDPAWVSNAIRLYAKGKVTVSAKSGYKLKSVTFNGKVNENNKGVKPTPKINSIEVDDDNLSWTGEETSVELWADGTAGNIAISSIEVTYYDPNAGTDPIYKYSVMVDPEIENGTVEISPASAAADATVTLTPAPAEGYELVTGSLKATNAVSGEELTLEDNKFTMPAANVNVTALFSLIPVGSVDDASFPSNQKNDRVIPVTANMPWDVSIKEDANNLVDGDPVVVYIDETHADNNYNGNIKFSYISENYSVFDDEVFSLSVTFTGHKELNKEITVTHKKRGVKLFLNTNASVTTETDVLTGSAEAADESFDFYVIKGNFDWNIVSVTINDVEYNSNALPSGYGISLLDVVKDTENHSYKGTVRVTFPSNSAVTETTYDRTIAIKVGDSRLTNENKTFTITQSGETYIDPDARYYKKVTTLPQILNGKYILAYGTTAYNAIGADRLTAATVDLAISEDMILSTDVTNALAIDIYGTASDYYMLFPDGNFLSVKNENSAIPSASIFKLNGFSVANNVVTITGHDGTQNRVLVNNGGKIAFYKSVGSYSLPTLYRLQDSENDVSEAKEFKVKCSDLSISSEGGNSEIIITGSSSVAWSASQTGGATLSATSGTGPTNLTVTIPQNKENVEKKYYVTVSTEDKGVPYAFKSKTFEFVQAAAGQGESSDPIQFVLDKETTGSSSTSYVTDGVTFTVDDVTFYVDEFNPSSQQVRVNQTGPSGNFELRNTTALPSAVKKITINVTSGTYSNNTGIYIYTASSAISGYPSSGGSNPVWDNTAETLTWTFTGTDKFFAFGIKKSNLSGTCKFGTIKIEF